MAKIDKHQNSRIVTIFRAGSFLSRSQGPGIDDFFSSSKQSIGSYFASENSQKVGTGLSFAEEALLLPVIIDTPADDKEFRKKLTEFYSDLTTNVPYGIGCPLEIGLEVNNDKPVSKDNMPLKLMDYIRYRHAIDHPWVAESKDKMEGDQMIQFYLFDKQNVQGKNTKKIVELDAAMQIYLKIKNEPDTVSAMLTVLGVDPRDITGKDADGQKIELLRAKVEYDPARFTKEYNEGDLEIRYDIQSMLNAKVFKQIGARIIDTETEKIIGNTTEEVIWFFKDEENSESVIALKARLQEAQEAAPVERKKKTVVN